jgi:WD40 repeat protein
MWCEGRQVFEPTAYMAQADEKGCWRLVWRGAEGPEFDSIAQVYVTADRSHLAYIAKRGNRAVFICDGKELPGSDLILYGDSSRPDRQIKRMPPELSATFSADGSHFAYVVRREKKYLVRCDGKEGPEYDKVWGVQISPDGKHLAYGAKTSDESLIVVDGWEGRRGDLPSRIIFSPDSQRVVWEVRMESTNRLFVDDKEVSPSFQNWWFSPDGRLFWSVAEGGRKFLFVEGARLPTAVSGDPLPVFSPSGRHVTYAGIDADGRPCAAIDGRAHKRASHILAWSPDEEHMLYASVEQQGAVNPVWCDDRKASVGTSQRTGVFSPDGRHAAYIALGDGGERVACDGLAGPPHEQIVSLIPGNTLRYIAWDENKTVARLIEVEWPAGRTWTQGFTEPQK